MISILILTKNEQQNLPVCLASVAWSDDIHVLDSFSTDDTVAIAHAAGAHVTQRPFDNWATHQNWGLANLPFRHAWVFYLDADEVVTPDLRASLAAAVKSPGHNVAFNVQRRDFFNGTWLRHVQTTAFYMRLFLPGKMRYERLVNPVSIPDGPVGQISGYLDHFPFSKGISFWVERHNWYSTFEAEIIFRQQGLQDPSLKTALTDKDFHTRRLHQKALFYRLPGRPLIKWCYMMFVRGALLDGSAGIAYATLASFYEYLIVLKTKELRLAAKTHTS